MKYSNDKVFVKNSSYARHRLKQRIIKQKLIIYECDICKIGPIWNYSTLVLQLDHINGVNDDHRIENLRFLCPNCHSQQDTYAGKNKINLNRSKKGYYVDGVKYNAKYR